MKRVFLKTISFWYQYGPDPEEWWGAGYTLDLETSKGTRRIHVDVDQIRSAECPKSVALRHPNADDLVQIFSQAQAVGESPFGSAETWPGAF